MPCQPVLTGQRFLTDMLLHVDCQAQTLGSYGYGALADAGSPVSVALTALLTLFIAILGLRLLLAQPIGGHDVIGDILKIGIVLTLATSWPAWRTVGYNLVMNAPTELAGAIGTASGLPTAGQALVNRLQRADDSIVALTIYGTGRNTSGELRSDTIGDTFRGVAITDQQGWAYGRIAFLGGVIGPLALVRLAAGLLLAAAPLMAGLLLFAGTRDLFFGWLRALGATGLGAMALAITNGVEVAVLEPWLQDALAQRGAQILTPSAPTELIVITLSFAVVGFGLVWIISRIAFFGGMRLPALFSAFSRLSSPITYSKSLTSLPHGPPEPPTRAFVIAEAVSRTLRQEEGGAGSRGRLIGSTSLNRTSTNAPGVPQPAAEPLGSSYRVSPTRRHRRTSAASERRDRLS